MRKADVPGEYSEVSEEDVRFLAQINRLEIDEADLAEVTLRLRAILTAVKQLDKIDLRGVEPIPVIPQRREQ